MSEYDQVLHEDETTVSLYQFISHFPEALHFFAYGSWYYLLLGAAVEPPWETIRKSKKQEVHTLRGL